MAANPATCESAIKLAEKQEKLPPLLLRTIGVVESGRVGPGGRITPWAWTIDADGVSHSYASKDEAVAAAHSFLTAGAKSVDVGCMQVNLQAHADAFDTMETAFDPAANTRYAAQFLRALYRRTSSWPDAAMAYHSQTPTIGKVYEEKVMALWPDAGAYRPVAMVLNNASATIATSAAPPVDPYATPQFSAWLKQNADDVAKLASDHQLIHD